MIRFFGNCFQRRREGDGDSRSENTTEYRRGRSRSTSNSGSEENPSEETEGPWRAFTRSVSNAWNQMHQPQGREPVNRTYHSTTTFNVGDDGGFTFRTFFQQPSAQRPRPRQAWGDMGAQTGRGNVPFRDEQQPSNGAPPASDEAISRLPEVTFQEADLVADGDKSCPICLELHRVGGKGVRLPCGHCFHAPCVRPWLKKHCMCPVCRFEIPTSDVKYEWSRKQRMKSRKRRIRLSELEGYTIRQLRGLAAEMSIDLSTAIEKRDVVEAISSSRQVEIVSEAAEPCDNMGNGSCYPTSYDVHSQGIQNTWESLEDLSIGELLSLMRVHGLSAKGCTEKFELVRIIRDAGIR